MGHANLENISKFWIRRLYAKGSMSVDDCVMYLMMAGEQLHASEGCYSDMSTLRMGVLEVVTFLILNKDFSRVIEPASLGRKQVHVFVDWITCNEDVGQWGRSEWAIFCGIELKFAPGWRRRYRDIPILGNITN